MIRGTTPTHTFNIPYNATDIDVVRIIYAQSDKEIFVKTTEECSLTDKSIVVQLTQEDTFKFDNNYPVQIQLRVKMKDTGVVMSTKVMRVTVGKCLENEVLL